MNTPVLIESPAEGTAFDRLYPTAPVLRPADIDDLIMNTLGGILGWLIFCAVRRTQPGREKLLKDFSE